MNLNAFLCGFPTVFGTYIRILDHVSKIRRFHSIPFEFQGFEYRYRGKVCRKPLQKWVILIALQFRYTFYGPQTKRLRARKIGLQYKIRKGRKQIWGRFSLGINNNPFFQRFSTGFDVLTTNPSPLDPVLSSLASHFLEQLSCCCKILVRTRSTPI